MIPDPKDVKLRLVDSGPPSDTRCERNDWPCSAKKIGKDFGGIELAPLNRTEDTGRALLEVVRTRSVRLPPQTLRVTTAGRKACSARQLVASIAGSSRNVKTAGYSIARCAAKR